MELLVFRHSEFERLYNCSLINMDDLPKEMKIHPIYGSLLLGLSIIYHIFYVPCLVALHRLSHDNSCYKFLFFIGIIDVMALWMCGFLTGIFGIFGIEFCAFPTLNYVAGAYGLALWIAESSAEWLLAVNRSLEMIAPTISRQLFDEGNRCSYWIVGISLYALSIFLFTTPLCYSAIHFTWLFNPFDGYLPKDAPNPHFANYVHAINNVFLSFAFPATYVTFLVAFNIKLRFYTQMSSHQSNWTNLQKLAFLQVFLLGIMNIFGCVFYLYMQYVAVTDTLMIIATFNWLHIHGLPPIIYLAINKSIRMDCIQMAHRLLFCAKQMPPQHSALQQLGHAGGTSSSGIIQMHSNTKMFGTAGNGMAVGGKLRPKITKVDVADGTKCARGLVKIS